MNLQVNLWQHYEGDFIHACRAGLSGQIVLTTDDRLRSPAEFSHAL